MFILAHNNNPDWQAGIQACLEQLKNRITVEQATLGFIYVTDALVNDLTKILTALKAEYPNCQWVGSVGMAINATQHEYYDQAAIAMLVTDINSESFEIMLSPDSLTTTGTDSVRFAVVHGDPRNGQLPNLIQDLPEQLGHGYLVGGLTSASQYYYQIANDITEGSISGVVFHHADHVVTGLTQGCSPISPVRTLTECDHHMALSIDNRPALDVFKEDIGEVLARDIDRAAGYIFAGFPVSGSDTGDYLVRNIVGIDPQNGYLAIGDYMTEGSPIMFCKRDNQTAIEDMRRMLQSLKERLDAPPQGGLYFSCMGRGRHMFGHDNLEMQLIDEFFPDVPIVGFYANGEIAGDRLYGYTGVLTLFR